MFLRARGGDAWDVWASYGFLEARRRYTRLADFGRYDPPPVPVRPEFEIPHTFQLAARRELPGERELEHELPARIRKALHVDRRGPCRSRRHHPHIWGAPRSIKIPVSRSVLVRANRPQRELNRTKRGTTRGLRDRPGERRGPAVGPILSPLHGFRQAAIN